MKVRLNKSRGYTLFEAMATIFVAIIIVLAIAGLTFFVKGCSSLVDSIQKEQRHAQTIQEPPGK